MTLKQTLFSILAIQRSQEKLKGELILFEFSGDSGVLANQELVIEPGSQSGITVEVGQKA